MLEIASELGMPDEERPFSLFEVWTAREVFVCGTGAEVVPVLSVDAAHRDGGIGPITARIVSAYHEVVRSQGAPIWPETVNEAVPAGHIALAGR